MVEFIKPQRKVNRVYIHCSASSNPEHGDIEVIRDWHRSKGWDDVGYHYFIPPKGGVQVGRSLELIPSAQKDFNTDSIAMCVHGLFESDFTINSLRECFDLCQQINLTYNKDVPVGGDLVTFHGHCEVSNRPCPVFDYKGMLNLSEEGVMPLEWENKNLDLFDSGLDVFKVQKQLNVFFQAHDYEIKEDGIFGQETSQALIYFQYESGLTPTGIVNPETRLRLPNLS